MTQSVPPAAPPVIVFCPGCVAKMRVPATLEPGKKVKCPKCKKPFDPSLASSRGSDRLATRQRIAAESAGLPEWVWAIIIGVACGIFFGGVNGMVLGVLASSANEMMGGSSNLLGGMLGYTLLGVGFFSVVGALIGLSIVFGGAPWFGYIVAFLSLIPALVLFGPWFGPGAAIIFGYLIVTVIDYKLYS